MPGRRSRNAQVVAEGNEVDGVLGEDLAVLVGDGQLDAVFAEEPQRIAGVGAADVHIAEHQVAVVGMHGGQHVGRIGGERVGGHSDQHAADLDARDGLVGDPGGQRAGDQLVVHGLVQVGGGELLRRGVDAAAHQRGVQHRVDFVEGQPVLDPAARSGRTAPGRTARRS